MNNTHGYWGYHLILDCFGCDLDAMKDRDTVAAFSKELVQRINMVAYGEPSIVHFGSGDKEGFTLVQLIETSNICGHFANDEQTIYFDIFSCKPYHPSDAIKVVAKYFKPAHIHDMFIKRGNAARVELKSPLVLK